MLPYWLMFLVWTAGAVQVERRQNRDSSVIFFLAGALFTTLMIGLRVNVGGDWRAYQTMYDTISLLTLPASFTVTDPGYAALNWLGTQFDLGIVFVNTVCALLFVGGFARLAWRQPNSALAMLVAVPYMIIVVAMGYTRQAAAIGIICFAIADASERHLVRLTIFIAIAALFHKTAILVLPITLVPILRRNILFGAVGGLLFLILFILLLRDTSDELITNYVQGDYDSQGAIIRAAMNVAAAVVFLLMRKNIEMPVFQKNFWTTCAILSILSIVALRLASASAGIDRLSLYLIPLQAVTYARLPQAISRNRQSSLPSIVIGVIGYSFLVQFVWLNYADNALYWIPYRNALFTAADSMR